jgi:hypothetical protein
VISAFGIDSGWITGTSKVMLSILEASGVSYTLRLRPRQHPFDRLNGVAMIVPQDMSPVAQRCGSVGVPELPLRDRHPRALGEHRRQRMTEGMKPDAAATGAATTSTSKIW